MDNIQCVTVLVVIPGNIHDANCTGGLPCLAPDHTPALIITHYMGGSGSSKSHIMGSCSSYSGSSLRHQIHHQTPIQKFPSPPYVPAALNLIYVSDKSVICMKVCHNNMFICHPLHYIHISSYRQLPSANCCNILIQIVLFVIYICGFAIIILQS